MAKKRDKDIHPPRFPDPLKPGGVPAEGQPEGARDATSPVADQVAAAEDAGGHIPPDVTVRPGGVVERTEIAEDATVSVEFSAEAPDGEAAPPLEEVAEAVATGEAEPGPPLPPEEAEQLAEGDVVDLAAEVPGPSPYGPAPGEAEPPRTPTQDEIDFSETVQPQNPSSVLKSIVLGTLDPGTELPIAGAPVLFCYRPGKWRAGVATSLAGIAADGNVMIDLMITEGEAEADVRSVRYGDGIANWKFPLERC